MADLAWPPRGGTAPRPAPAPPRPSPPSVATRARAMVVVVVCRRPWLDWVFFSLEGGGAQEAGATHTLPLRYIRAAAVVGERVDGGGGARGSVISVTGGPALSPPPLPRAPACRPQVLAATNPPVPRPMTPGPGRRRTGSRGGAGSPCRLRENDCVCVRECVRVCVFSPRQRWCPWISIHTPRARSLLAACKT